MQGKLWKQERSYPRSCMDKMQTNGRLHLPSLSITGVIFAAGEETSVASARFSKMTKLNLDKIWRQKREDARKRLEEILEKQKQSVNQ